MDNKLKMHSPDLTAANIDKLAVLFPNCVTESRDETGQLRKSVDFDLLRQEFNDAVVEGPVERYMLNWPGKREAIVAANAPVYKTLRPCEAESVDFDMTKNLYIEGDNLEVLKLLQETYLGKVKMIYIDPPYNTGNDFIYDDNFMMTKEEYEAAIEVRDEQGNIRFQQNNAANPRFHSDWLSMIYPRLKIARDMLSDDGVCFVSIDDNEASSLKLVMDEVFGANNYLATHYVQVRYASKTLAEKNAYQKLIEQVLVYKKSSHIPIQKMEEYTIDKFCWKITELTTGKRVSIGGKDVFIFRDGEYKIEKVDASITGLKEIWATGTVLIANASGKYFGTFLSPRKEVDGLGTLYKVIGVGEDGLGYRYFTGPKKESATKGKFFSGVPTRRVKELNEGESLKSQPIPNYYDLSAQFGNCRQEGDTDFRGGKKPTAFLRELMSQAIGCLEGALVLDFFAGSSSTAHAVMQLNAEDGGNRRFIMVQLPEPLEDQSEMGKAGFNNICEIGKERIRRAGKKIKEANATNAPNLDVGFRVFKVDSSNMKDVYYTPDTLEQSQLDLFADAIKEDRTAEDLLFQVFLDCGLDLALPIAKEKIDGKTVFVVDQNVLMACFAADVSEALIRGMAARKPLRAVFLDRSFEKDSTKLNVTQIFKQLSPDTEVKTL